MVMTIPQHGKEGMVMIVIDYRDHAAIEALTSTANMTSMFSGHKMCEAYSTSATATCTSVHTQAVINYKSNFAI